MTKIIVLTDLHMVPEGGRIIGLDPYTRLQKGIQHINRHHPDADCVIITGDLTHKGDLESYTRLKALLTPLVCPYYLLIGNHDRRENFIEVFPNQGMDENGFIQSAITCQQGVLLLLDTLYAPPYEFPKSYSGLLCEKRMAWLKNQLEQAKVQQQDCFIFMHHPPHATGFVGMDAIALSNAKEFYNLVLQYPQVKHITAGHVHRTISGNHKGISYSVFKSTCHQQPLIFNADDTSLSVDEPAAYGLIMLSPDEVQVHTEDFEISGVNQTVVGNDEINGH